MPFSIYDYRRCHISVTAQVYRNKQTKNKQKGINYVDMHYIWPPVGGAKVIKFLTFNTALLGHDYTHLQLELNGNSSSPVLNVTVINTSDLKAYK